MGKPAGLMGRRQRRRAYSEFVVRCKPPPASTPDRKTKGDLRMILPTTLCLTAAAVLINLWLGGRISKVRHEAKISIGDGGHEQLVCRMRAQANFIENTPLALILIAVIELAGKGGTWLAVVGGLFVLSRVAHPLGMDRPSPNALRAGGTALAMLIQLGLAIVAVLIALQVI